MSIPRIVVLGVAALIVAVLVSVAMAHWDPGPDADSWAYVTHAAVYNYDNAANRHLDCDITALLPKSNLDHAPAGAPRALLGGATTITYRYHDINYSHWDCEDLVHVWVAVQFSGGDRHDFHLFLPRTGVTFRAVFGNVLGLALVVLLGWTWWNDRRKKRQASGDPHVGPSGGMLVGAAVVLVPLAVIAQLHWNPKLPVFFTLTRALGITAIVLLVWVWSAERRARR